SFLAGSGQRFPGGVTVDESFRSTIEERWFPASRESGARDIAAFLRADKALVEEEATRLGGALRRVFDMLPDGGRALIVGHSPMHEAAVYGLTRQVIAPIAKGGGVRVVQDGRDFRIENWPDRSRVDSASLCRCLFDLDQAFRRRFELRL